MSARQLIIEVVHTPPRAREQATHAGDDIPSEYLFAHSPVRVGRSLLNELTLDYAFVSHCHGMFYFTDDRIEFVDVGSTNGSFVGGVRLAINQRSRLSPPAAVTIGALRLLVRLECRVESNHTPAAQSAPSTRLCEQFALSFLELRRGQQQLIGALGLPLSTRGELQALDTPHALLAYLLDPAASTDRIDELSRAHADLMRHEVALVSALAAGARELLDELSPKNLAPRGVGGLAGWFARLLGHDERWSTLERKVDELREESALSAVVMGRSFARAYAAALGTHDERAAAPDDAVRRALGRPRAHVDRLVDEDQP
jgi:hypothetical protein